MSRLLAGSLIILYVLVQNLIVSFVTDGAVDDASFPGCQEVNNATECGDIGATSFVQTMGDVAVTGIEGSPDIFNALYVVTHGLLLAVGILLIVMSFIPFTN